MDGDGRRGHLPRHESRVEEQIRAAAEAGAFDDLPGAGKPLRPRPVDDENWWVREKLRREGMSTDVLLPPSLQLRKEIERLPETVARLRTEDDVRRVVADLDRRIVGWLRFPNGPRVPIKRVDAEAVVERWRAERAARAEAAAAARATAGARAPRDASGRARGSWWRRLRGR